MWKQRNSPTKTITDTLSLAVDEMYKSAKSEEEIKSEERINAEKWEKWRKEPITEKTVVTYAKRFFDIPNFVITDGNRPLIETLCRYFNKSDVIPKGLFLSGTVGVGKTMLFRIFEKIARDKDGMNKFTIKHVDAIVNQYKNGGDEFYNHLLESTYGVNLVIDDLGVEKSEIVHYGNKMDVMSEFLYQRYDLFQTRKATTHFSTNFTFLDEKAIIQRYGLRLLDRFKEMTYQCVLKSKSSRRTWSTVDEF